MLKDFAIFITTHGRANNQITLNTLERYKCSYPIYLIVDDEDTQLDAYLNKYGNIVKVFNKQKYINKVDTIMYPKQSKSVVFARQFGEDLAKQLSLSSYLILDDDIKSFIYRFVDNSKFKSKEIVNVDSILEVYSSFALENNLACVSFGTEASYIGGKDSILKNNLKRRCFNAFIRNMTIPINWISNMNEDYATSVQNGKLGKLFFEVSNIGVIAKDTGKATNAGGMLDLYKVMSPFQRAYICAISNPSCIYVGKGKKGNYIIKCKWDKAVPKIISSRNQRR